MGHIHTLRAAVAVTVAAAVLAVPSMSASGARGPESRAERPTGRKSGVATDPRFDGTHALPSFLVENTGWTHADARWVAKCRGYRAFLTDDGVILGVPERRPAQRGHGNYRGQFADDAGSPAAVVSMRFEGARREAPFTRGEKLPGRASFFLGDDASCWRSDLPLHAALDRPSLLDGVDAAWRIEGGDLRFDLRFAAGADPAAAAMRFDGADEVRVTEEGGLVLRTGPGELRLSPPVAWHEAPEGRRPVAARFAVRGGRVRFDVPERNPALPLVVDPTITYASYFGGSANDSVVGIAADASGAVLVGGSTASLNLGVTQGAYQTTHAGGVGATFPNDYFAAKFGADGRTVEWCTFVGGSGWDDGYSAAADASGGVCVGGESASTNAPLKSAGQTSHGGGLSDGWIVKIAPGGSSLSWATYLGGGGQDQLLTVALDPSGNAVVAGWTTSTNLPLSGALQTAQGGNTSDGFVAKIPVAGGAFAFSTYLGGNGLDQCNALTTDAIGDIYVTGWTNSTNFVTRTAVQSTYTPSTAITPNDAFVTKLSANGAPVVWSTYYGGSSFDEGNGITVDADRQAHVIGWTGSSNFPLRAPLQAAKSGSDDMFVLKFTTAGSAIVWATLLGGSGREYGAAVDMDSSSNLCCAGMSTSSNFPLVNPVQASFAGGGGANFPDDTVLFRIRSDGSKLVSSTYFGGSNYEDTLAIDVDASDAIHFCGFTASTDLPVQNGLSGSMAGLNEGFVGRLAPSIPRAPTGLTASSLTLQPVQLAWTDNSNDETGFEIERRVGPTPWSVVKSVGPGVTTAEDAQVSSNVTFTYRVRALNGDGASAPSNEASVTTAGALPRRRCRRPRTASSRRPSPPRRSTSTGSTARPTSAASRSSVARAAASSGRSS